MPSLIFYLLRFGKLGQGNTWEKIGPIAGGKSKYATLVIALKLIRTKLIIQK